MLKKLKNFFIVHQCLYQLLLLFGLVCVCTDIFAKEGVDLLAGTADDLLKTINDTGKSYIYLAEGILSIALYTKTKNPLVLAGIIVVSVFLNIMLSMATPVVA